MKYAVMVERIRARLGLTTLRYQTVPDMIRAIGLPREKLCTYCWTAETEAVYGGASSPVEAGQPLPVLA